MKQCKKMKNKHLSSPTFQILSKFIFTKIRLILFLPPSTLLIVQIKSRLNTCFKYTNFFLKMSNVGSFFVFHCNRICCFICLVRVGRFWPILENHSNVQAHLWKRGLGGGAVIATISPPLNMIRFSMEMITRGLRHCHFTQTVGPRQPAASREIGRA